MPHLSSLLRKNCFFTLYLNCLGRGSGEGGGRVGETHESVHQQQPSWIESLCEWYWSVASSISENCSAQHNTKEMAYLCLTCSYCCIFDWQYLYVGHTYAWYLTLCFFKTEEEERSNVIVLYLFQPQQHLFVNTFFVHILVHAYNITIVWHLDLVNYVSTTSISHVSFHFFLTPQSPYCSIFSFDVKQFWMGYSKKSKSVEPGFF